MKSLIQSLALEIEQIEAGTANLSHLDNAVNQAQILLEKLYIVRYSAYKASIVEVETPSAPVFDLSDSDAQEENEMSSGLFAKENTAPVTNTMHQTEIPLETKPLEVESTLEASVDSELEMFARQVNEVNDEVNLDLQEILNVFTNAKLNVSPLTGNYTLKEKLQYINLMFDGSSEEFSFAIKALEGAKNIEDAIKHLKFLSEKHKWEKSNKEILTKFVEKVFASHAQP
jgi:hypothetical protein